MQYAVGPRTHVFEISSISCSSRWVKSGRLKKYFLLTFLVPTRSVGPKEFFLVHWIAYISGKSEQVEVSLKYVMSVSSSTQFSGSGFSTSKFKFSILTWYIYNVSRFPGISTAEFISYLTFYGSRANRQSRGLYLRPTLELAHTNLKIPFYCILVLL